MMTHFRRRIGPVPASLLLPRPRGLHCSCLMSQVRSPIHSERSPPPGRWLKRGARTLAPPHILAAHARRRLECDAPSPSLGNERPTVTVMLRNSTMAMPMASALVRPSHKLVSVSIGADPSGCLPPLLVT